jgi:hypothetical protein
MSNFIVNGKLVYPTSSLSSTTYCPEEDLTYAVFEEKGTKQFLQTICCGLISIVKYTDPKTCIVKFKGDMTFILLDAKASKTDVYIDEAQSLKIRNKVTRHGLELGCFRFF